LKAQDGLHAKVYITTSGVIIGSANASNNGLNQEGAEIDFQREAAVECTDATIMENASEWFDKHWDEASKIDKKRLDRIRPIWLAKRKSGLLSLLVHNPLTFAKIPIRLVVFEDLGDDAQYTQIWNDVKRNYSKEQIDRHGYNLGNHPIYVDPTRRWNIKSGEFVVNYWIRRKSWSLTTDGGVWCVRETVPGPNGERVILADQVTTVYGFNFFNSDYRILKSCVQDHLKNNSSRDFKNHILLDVQLGELPKKQRDIFKRLVDAIDKPAKRRPASTSRNRPSK
jgi:hypothetical protein